MDEETSYKMAIEIMADYRKPLKRWKRAAPWEPLREI